VFNPLFGAYCALGGGPAFTSRALRLERPLGAEQRGQQQIPPPPPPPPSAAARAVAPLTAAPASRCGRPTSATGDETRERLGRSDVLDKQEPREPSSGAESEQESRSGSGTRPDGLCGPNFNTPPSYEAHRTRSLAQAFSAPARTAPCRTFWNRRRVCPANLALSNVRTIPRRLKSPSSAVR
jgi:hypothetical protein